MDIALLWEDNTLLAANKPAGLLTIRDGYQPYLPHLHAYLGQIYGRLWVVHRLDKDTSGVILFARTAGAHRDLNMQFEHRETHKEYHALVHGSPAWDEYEIDLPLRVNGDRKHRTIVDLQKGRAALTACRVLARYQDFSVISAQPRTGYTHQIRAHLAAFGLPLVADPLYLTRLPQSKPHPSIDLPIRRTALHAASIQFIHPDTNSPMHLKAPYPTDFDESIQYLSQHLDE